MLLNIFIRPSFPTLLQSPINCGAFCMLAGLVIVPVVSLITRKPDEDFLESVFGCYERKVLVSVKDYISEEE